MPCGYCGRKGHRRAVCETRLEDYYGVPADRLDDDEVADGG